MLKNLLDACGAALAFFVLGFALAFGGNDPASSEKTFVGTSNFFVMDVDDLAFWLFQYAFSAASATIVAGTLAERCQMVAYLCYSVLLGGFVYPVVAHSAWSAQGFLSNSAVDPLWGVGMIDFAGSGVVHMTGGTTALFATMILGPRRGRFHDDTGRKLEKPKEFPGHSVALQVGLLAFNETTRSRMDILLIIGIDLTFSPLTSFFSFVGFPSCLPRCSGRSHFGLGGMDLMPDPLCSWNPSKRTRSWLLLV